MKLDDFHPLSFQALIFHPEYNPSEKKTDMGLEKAVSVCFTVFHMKCAELTTEVFTQTGCSLKYCFSCIIGTVSIVE